MSDINKRNAETVRLTLESMNKKIADQQIQINGLQSTISTLNNQLNEVQQILNIMRAKQGGRGPTVKE